MPQPRAIAYCRVSDPRQVKDEGSLDRQEQDARRYADRKGYLLDRVFVEPGESAKTDSRPVLQEMLAHCKQNRQSIDVLVVPKIDRFARYAQDYFNLKALLGKLGIRIESVGENIEDTPAGRLSEGMLAIVAQFDNEVRAERCKDGMVDAARAGRWMWQAPYGFHHVKLPDFRPNIAPYDAEAVHVRRAFELMDREDYAVPDLLRILKGEGMKSTRAHLYRLLTNKIYIGVIAAFGFEVAGAYPLVPIIDEDRFYRVQLRLGGGTAPSAPKRKRRTHALINPDFPLKGTIVCRCGGRFTGSWSTGKYHKYAYYHCYNCSKAADRRDLVEDRFVGLLNQYAMPECKLNQIAGRVSEATKERKANAEHARKQAEREIEKLSDLQRAIVLKNASGVIPDDLAKQEIETLRYRLADLKGKMMRNENPSELSAQAAEFAKRWLTEPGGFWLHADTEGKQKFQSLVLPTGIQYLKSDGFGTQQIKLLERVKELSEGESKRWWTDETPVETLSLLENVFHAFHIEC